MKDVRTLALLVTGCLLAGIGSFIAPTKGVQSLALAGAFAFPAVLPFFFRDRSFGLAAAVIALGAVVFASFVGASVVDVLAVRRALLVRNLQFASVGALAGALAVGAAWIEDIAVGRAREDIDA